MLAEQMPRPKVGPTSGQLLLDCQLNPSGQAIRRHGDGITSRLHDSAQISSDDALRGHPGEFEAHVLDPISSRLVMNAQSSAVSIRSDLQQTVRILALDHPSGLIRTGDRCTCRFEFISHQEYLKEGQLILLREAKTKVLGVVTRILG